MAKKKRGGKGRFKSKRALSAQIAQAGLSSLINKAQDNETFRNKPASDASVIQDMPEKFQEFIKRNTKNNRMNSAAQAIFDQYDDGRSEFQRQLNRNIQSNPFFAQAYAEKFPKTNLAMKGLPMVFSSLTPGLNLAKQIFQGAKSGATDIGTRLRESLQPTFDGLRSLLPDFRNQETELVPQEQTKTFIDDDIFTSRDATNLAFPPDLSFASNQDMQRIFAFPQPSLARLPSQGTVGNYLVSDPGGLLRMANMPVSTQRGFADGGIASLQDPNYNLLMEASDFSL